MRLTINLYPPDMDRLRKMAIRARRDVRDQAAVLLEQVLEEYYGPSGDGTQDEPPPVDDEHVAPGASLFSDPTRRKPE